MKKEMIRKEFIKLKNEGHSYSQCRKILIAKYDYGVHARTLQRWINRLDNHDWDLKDISTRPKTIHRKITSDIENKVISLRKQTGWGAEKIENFIDIGHTSIGKIIKKHSLINESKRKKKRNKYIRWERKHPNSLWQIDHSDQKIDGKWVISIVDDCSRKSLAFVPVNQVTTDIVIKIIDDLGKIYGYPKQILTDNGSAYGLKSKHSRFDIKCRKRNIEHIRSAVHSPTTCGKVERLFQTFKQEFEFCNKDPELWRMRYNHFRPHTSLNGKTPSEVYEDLNLFL